MKVGDEILIRAKVVNVNDSKYGSFVEVEVPGIVQKSMPLGKTIRFSIPLKDQPKTIVGKSDNEVVDQVIIFKH